MADSVCVWLEGEEVIKFYVKTTCSLSRLELFEPVCVCVCLLVFVHAFARPFVRLFVCFKRSPLSCLTPLRGDQISPTGRPLVRICRLAEGYLEKQSIVLK